MPSFGQRLADTIAKHGPLCVGVDPTPGLLEAWGAPRDARGAARLCDVVLEAAVGAVGIVKPQAAYFEQFGPAGTTVLFDFMAAARNAGLIVILDAKRGDIGDTSRAYGRAYFGGTDGPAVDAITASPYLGLGALQPMIEVALESSGGVIVVVRSSNPEGRVVQTARVDRGVAVEEALLSSIGDLNDGSAGDGLGAVGAVIAATGTPFDEALLTRMNGPILCPGIGHQGGQWSDLLDHFTAVRGQVVPSASRSLLAHGPDPDALRSALVEAAAACRAVLSGQDTE